MTSPNPIELNDLLSMADWNGYLEWDQALQIAASHNLLEQFLSEAQPGQWGIGALDLADWLGF